MTTKAELIKQKKDDLEKAAKKAGVEVSADATKEQIADAILAAEGSGAADTKNAPEVEAIHGAPVEDRHGADPVELSQPGNRSVGRADVQNPNARTEAAQATQDVHRLAEGEGPATGITSKVAPPAPAHVPDGGDPVDPLRHVGRTYPPAPPAPTRFDGLDYGTRQNDDE